MVEVGPVSAGTTPKLPQNAPVQNAPLTESRMVRALREALIAGALTGVLGFFFLALRTDIATGGLVVSTRWGLWLTAIGIVFAGRLALSLFYFDRTWGGSKVVKGAVVAVLPSGKVVARVALIFALILPFFFMILFPNKDRQYIDLAILIMTYIMLGWGLNIVVGLAGLLDLGYVAFYAVGAYSFGLSAQYLGFGFWMALPMAGLLAAT
ncbi:MAG: DUF3382 domain-containing protein, partial [Deltaproteobacteria bacterium]